MGSEAQRARSVCARSDISRKWLDAFCGWQAGSTLSGWQAGSTRSVGGKLARRCLGGKRARRGLWVASGLDAVCGWQAGSTRSVGGKPARRFLWVASRLDAVCGWQAGSTLSVGGKLARRGLWVASWLDAVSSRLDAGVMKRVRYQRAWLRIRTSSGRSLGPSCRSGTRPRDGASRRNATGYRRRRWLCGRIPSRWR